MPKYRATLKDKRKKRVKMRRYGGRFAALPIDEQIDRRAVARREILLVGPIDQTVHYYLARLLHYMVGESKERITITLNPPGGTLPDGLAVYDLITNIAKRVPIHIVGTGACMSMGVIILQAATKRYATRNTSFLLHELQGINVGTLGQQKDVHGEMLRLQSTLNDILAERTGLSKKELTKLYERQEKFLDVDEAKKYNLIDGVIE